MAQLREMLEKVHLEEQAAAFDDCHHSYVRRSAAARRERSKLEAEINSRLAHYEAINGK